MYNEYIILHGFLRAVATGYRPLSHYLPEEDADLGSIQSVQDPTSFESPETKKSGEEIKISEASIQQSLIFAEVSDEWKEINGKIKPLQESIKKLKRDPMYIEFLLIQIYKRSLLLHDINMIVAEKIIPLCDRLSLDDSLLKLEIEQGEAVIQKLHQSYLAPVEIQIQTRSVSNMVGQISDKSNIDRYPSNSASISSSHSTLFNKHEKFEPQVSTAQNKNVIEISKKFS